MWIISCTINSCDLSRLVFFYFTSSWELYAETMVAARGSSVRWQRGKLQTVASISRFSRWESELDRGVYIWNILKIFKYTSFFTTGSPGHDYKESTPTHYLFQPRSRAPSPKWSPACKNITDWTWWTKYIQIQPGISCPLHSSPITPTLKVAILSRCPLVFFTCNEEQNSKELLPNVPRLLNLEST